MAKEDTTPQREHPIPETTTQTHSILHSILYWDFFGPHAAPTATHFQKHLREFLRSNALSAKSVDLKSEEDFHMGVVCVMTDGKAARAVAQRLRAAPRSIFPKEDESTATEEGS